MLPAASLLLALAMSPDAPPRSDDLRRLSLSAACHVAADRLKVEHAGTPAVYSVTVEGEEPLSSAQGACLDNRIGVDSDNAVLVFEDAHVDALYRLSRAHRILRRHGIVGRLPIFHREREPLAAFAIRLERFCGAAPGSVLEIGDDEIYARLARGPRPTAWQRARWECVINAAIATGHDPLAMPHSQ